MSKKRKPLYLGVAFLIIGLVCFPYLKAEYNTKRYGDQFADAYLQTHMVDGIEYYKVIQYTPHTAEVVCVEKDHAACIVLTLVNHDTQWKMESWDAVWSKSGSADSFMWPYYR